MFVGFVQSDWLLGLIAVLSLAVVFLIVEWVRAVRKSKQPDGHCTFPGCIAARIELRRLADVYPVGIPSEMVRAIIDGVEAHEHH